jgi:hypothetical protein
MRDDREAPANRTTRRERDGANGRPASEYKGLLTHYSEQTRSIQMN